MSEDGQCVTSSKISQRAGAWRAADYLLSRQMNEVPARRSRRFRPLLVFREDRPVEPDREVGAEHART